MSLLTVDLNDKYRPEAGRLYLNGTQALVRLLLVQSWRDRARGLNTGGFVSGYRGSPLGSFDRELWRARRSLDEANVKFWPAVNEDLAATAVWGTQMTGEHGAANVQGAYAMWYGKGAGLDRSGDAIRHAAASGSSPHGGVLAVVGDDHAQKSSTHPYFSEPTFADLLIPVLYPADIAEVLEFGVLGWGLSRFSGAWVGLKTLGESLDCSASIEDRSVGLQIRTPTEAVPPPGAVHFRWPDPWRDAEIRWINHRLPAIHAFARANSIDRVALASSRPRLGIVTAGKSYLDVLQALRDMGLTVQQAAEHGIAIYKVGMTWPLELEGLRRFARELPEILVVEEKRPIIEDQLRASLYDLPQRPVITGKKDAEGRWQFPWIGELSADHVVRVLARKLGIAQLPAKTNERLAALAESERALAEGRPIVARPPYFCSGCPHNTSTKIPEGSLGIAGVGCHYMAADMDRQTTTFSHMGGEGATWIGEAPFSKTRHMFVNLGEGTYFHSGSLAVRACIAAGVNITYKILYNDAVAMTGGQPVDGPISVEQVARQLYAEGIRGIRIVAEQPERFSDAAALPPDTVVLPRTELDAVQRALREVPGVTALIYDQTCAAEKRRRRKRKELEDPARRAFINAAVCEGCGDCSKTSNCLSVVPLETELGRKRQIDQSSCNKDFSCVEGFCPSFVTVVGGKLRKAPLAATTTMAAVPDPGLPAIEGCYEIFITGVGGTGVVTIGALLGMAAHLEGKACSVLDQLGMAQKGGAVVTHVRLARHSADIDATRVRTAGAHLLLGLDLAVALQPAAFSRIAANRTHVILNTHETITGAFTRSPDLRQPTQEMLAAVVKRVGADRVESLDATRLATALIGDSIATSVFALGFAFQKGLIPLSRESLVQAIRLNAVAVEANIQTFEWGRRAAFNRGAVEALTASGTSVDSSLPATIEDLVAHRARFLESYQDQAYAQRYRAFMQNVIAQEAQHFSGRTGFSRAVAESLFKLMSYKDEYEVARLYTDGTFMQTLREQFEGDFELEFHMAPPALAGRRQSEGNPRKRKFGGWMFTLMRGLAGLRRLRGTPFDVFGYTSERRMERRLVDEYRIDIERLLPRMTEHNYDAAVNLAKLPLSMRGFGHVKEAAVRGANERRSELLQAFPDHSNHSSL